MLHCVVLCVSRLFGIVWRVGVSYCVAKLNYGVLWCIVLWLGVGVTWLLCVVMCWWCFFFFSGEGWRRSQGNLL